jgi:hypothetical protein
MKPNRCHYRDRLDLLSNFSLCSTSERMLWKAPSFEESGLSETRLIDHRRALGAQRRGMRLGVARHRGQPLAPGDPLPLPFWRGERFGMAANSVRKSGSVWRDGI